MAGRDYCRARGLFDSAAASLRPACFHAFQISSSSSSPTSPSFLPRARNSSSTRLNRETNLSVASCNTRFRIEIAFAREIDDGEEQIADLVRNRAGIARRDGLFRFRQFLVNFRDDIGDFGPIKIDPRRFLLRFLRPHQGRERRGKIGEVMAAGVVLLFALDRLPLFHDAIRVAHAALAENMRMPADQFGRHFLQHFVDIEPAGFLRDLRVHHGQQDQVAEFFAQILIVARPDGARDFVRFLDQAGKKRLVRLLAVPRAALGRAEFRDDVAKTLKVIGDW